VSRKCPGGKIIKQDGFPNLRPMILHRLLVVAASGLCLVVGGISALGAEHNFDGVYTGKRSLTKGSAGPNCPAEDNVSVTIHGETLTFTNSILKKFTESFYPGPDGSFGETYTDEGGAVVHYHGRIIGDVMDADVSNPPCEYHWHLKKE
jgi:hypothetical protein